MRLSPPRKTATSTRGSRAFRSPALILVWAVASSGGDDRETAPGVEASATGYLTNHLGIEGDFDGHFKHKTFTFPSASVVDVSLKSFNFLGGPHYRFSSRGKITPYLRTLLGVNHSSVSSGLINSAGGLLVAGTGASETDFAMKFGGGLDVGWTKRAAIRFGARAG